MYELTIFDLNTGKEFKEVYYSPYLFEKRKKKLFYSKRLVILRVRKVY